jgi:DNA-binding GntR family transcriptional regulator
MEMLSANAENALYEDIISGRLAPGQKLQPDELKERYNVGVSPIREALLRLSSDGLVERQGNRGFRVAVASESDLSDIADMRCHLSCLALKLSIERGDFEWEATLVSTFHQVEKMAALVIADPVTYAETWERLNRQFHFALESACGSPWLLRFCRMAHDQSERYRRHFLPYSDLMPKSQGEHRQILDAALVRDAKAACHLLEEHFRKGTAVVKKVMAAKTD